MDQNLSNLHLKLLTDSAVYTIKQTTSEVSNLATSLSFAGKKTMDGLHLILYTIKRIKYFLNAALQQI